MERFTALKETFPDVLNDYDQYLMLKVFLGESYKVQNTRLSAKFEDHGIEVKKVMHSFRIACAELLEACDHSTPLHPLVKLFSDGQGSQYFHQLRRDYWEKVDGGVYESQRILSVHERMDRIDAAVQQLARRQTTTNNTLNATHTSPPGVARTLARTPIVAAAYLSDSALDEPPSVGLRREMFYIGKNVRRLWDEWDVGVDGKKSLREMCQLHKMEWRPKAGSIRMQWCPNKAIIDFIEAYSTVTKMTAAEVLEQLPLMSGLEATGKFDRNNLAAWVKTGGATELLLVLGPNKKIGSAVVAAVAGKPAPEVEAATSPVAHLADTSPAAHLAATSPVAHLAATSPAAHLAATSPAPAINPAVAQMAASLLAFMAARPAIGGPALVNHHASEMDRD
ncbi:hypothetical protein FOA52_006626 [Chlamydomonas sp. UWO 241]|nr:hypothetical protein FOA52_006626 [Chlamydomonas sp. UWO 241]